MVALAPRGWQGQRQAAPAHVALAAVLTTRPCLSPAEALLRHTALQEVHRCIQVPVAALAPSLSKLQVVLLDQQCRIAGMKTRTRV